MAEDKDTDFAVDRLNLLERGKDEDGCLAEAGFCLAENVGRENCLGETDLLDFGGVFETFLVGD